MSVGRDIEEREVGPVHGGRRGGMWGVREREGPESEFGDVGSEGECKSSITVVLCYCMQLLPLTIKQSRTTTLYCMKMLQ